MTLVPGSRIGPYDVTGPIGAGGMGEVYRARDSRLGRDVAIKVLPAAFAGDQDRLRRFEQEVRAVGRLNHPNILVAFDVGTTEGAPYLVCELLDGETLRTRLGRGRMPLARALDIAGQIARGLHAAHTQGIVHRDLKPDNVFLTRDGRVKILDFGLAKLTMPVPAQAGVETATGYQTEAGMVLGTAGYMSPEQIRGEEADHRADLFAFGAVLYELLTGRRAFTGTTAIEIMSGILTETTPEVTAMDPALSPGLGRLVHRCLERDRSDRFQSAADLAFAIDALAGPAASPRAGNRRGRTVLAAGWILATGLAISLAAALVMWSGSTQPSALHTASVVPEEGSTFGSFAVSPDGRWLAYTNAGAGKSRLWVKSLDRAVVQAFVLAGTDGAAFPFWSPDSRSVGFFADNQLKIVGADGGQPRSLTAVTDSRGGAWGADDVIVFAPERTGPLFQVSARDGGSRVPATRLAEDPKHTTHRWPHFLPDGRRFIFFARSADPNATGLYAGTLGESHASLLVPASTDGRFAPPGVLLFVRGKSLMAQPLNPDTLVVTGDAVSIVPNVGLNLPLNRAAVSISTTGTLVYGSPEDTQPIWFDRTGKQIGAIAPPSIYSNVYLSRDGTRVAIEKPDPVTGANDIHMIELDRESVMTRFTSNPDSDSRASWTPDDRGLVWASNQSNPHGRYDLYTKLLGSAKEEPLLVDAESKIPTDVSPDGQFLFYESIGPTSKTQIKVMTLAGDRRSFPLLGSGFNEAQARMSPDGKWISYTTDKDGADEIYVVAASAVLPTPARDGRSAAPVAGRRVSASGGVQAMWRGERRSSELFYLSRDRRLMAVAMTDAGPGIAATLFEARIGDSGRAVQLFAPANDGQRFLVLARMNQSPGATVVFNWQEVLKKPK